MTPLHRWVLLGLLASSVGGFAAHRKDDACVPLCRAQLSRSPEKIRGGCDVPQSDGDHNAVRRLFRACLIPCDTPGPPEKQERPLFQDSPDCRSFRDKLIGLQSCYCRSLDYDEAGRTGFGYWEAWAERLFRDHGQTSGKRSKDGSSVWTEVENTLNDDTPSNRPADKRGTMVEEDQDESDYPDSLEMEDTDGATALAAPQPGSTPDPNLSEEYPVDWDLWCMAQCDNGQGGSACNCDIIP